MIDPIHIDTQALSEQFMLSQEHVEDLKEAVVSTVTSVVVTQWKEEAKKSLGSTRAQYINSIIVGEEGRFSNVIKLVGQLPNMIESGIDPFDMKKGFEASSKKVITKDKDGNMGWYLTIPNTFAQPGAIAESTAFSGVLPKDVAKALKGKQKSHGEHAALSLSDVPSEFKIPKMRPKITLGSGIEKAAHETKGSIYEGLHKNKKSGSIMSFRRVSNNSDDSSWIHTGIKAHNLADKALVNSRIPDVTGDVIDEFLDQLIAE